jgi:hypothetical protein
VKQPLNPLIPLDQLKGVVAGLVGVPKAKIERDSLEKSPRKTGKRKAKKA